MVEVIVVGAMHLSRYVTSIILIQIDEERIEREEQSGLTHQFVNLPTLT